MVKLLGGHPVPVAIPLLPVGQESRHPPDHVVQDRLEPLLGGPAVPLEENVWDIEQCDGGAGVRSAPETEPEPRQDDGQVIEPPVEGVVRVVLVGCVPSHGSGVVGDAHGDHGRGENDHALVSHDVPRVSGSGVRVRKRCALGGGRLSTRRGTRCESRSLAPPVDLSRCPHHEHLTPCVHSGIRPPHANCAFRLVGDTDPFCSR
jgi:hypothetical protein